MHEQHITLAHGNGGRLMHELVSLFAHKFKNKILSQQSDAAIFNVPRGKLAFSTDSYVVKPLFFPGGDIGKLAVCGTVNDLAVMGARPLYLSLSFIIEEGFPMEQLDVITTSIQKTAKLANISIVTGDTKVVEKGAADKLFVNTSGVGIIEYRLPGKARKNDVVIINGGIAEHGMAIFNARESLGFQADIKSDCQPLNKQIRDVLLVSKRVSIMRDPTRGGLATTLNEIARFSGLGIDIFEDDIPIKKPVKSLCDVLGFDPLYVANEGKFVCFVNAADADKVCKKLGKQARVIGKVTSDHKKEVRLCTAIGGNRIIPMLEVDQLPRIC